MTGICLTCGLTDHLEAHHVAGQHNDDALVVPVCVGCHRILTSWQYAAGIELRADADRSPEDRQRALIVGVLHLVQMIAQRRQFVSSPSEGLWELTARAASRVLDLAAPPDRAGRWGPDPTITAPPVLPVPVVADPASEEVRLRELAWLIPEVLRRLGDLPPMTIELWKRIAADPRSLVDRLAALDAGDHAGPSVTILVQDNLDAMQRVVLWLATLDDWASIDERDLDEVRVWQGAARALLDKIARRAA